MIEEDALASKKTLGSAVAGNHFYQMYFDRVIYALLVSMIALLAFSFLVIYQFMHRPLPDFFAQNEAGQRMVLTRYFEPNLQADTLLKWASRAAVAAYTFDFVNYNKQIAAARPFFTDLGWVDYQASIASLIKTITQDQLFVNGVVAGPPVISNQGDLPGAGYSWRVQMPFLVTYQSADAFKHNNFTVFLTITKVPTWQNPQAMGIDQFVMN